MDIVPTKIEFRKRDIPEHLLKYFNFKHANRWILRNKIKWAKQVLIKKQNKTIGSVMPSSVKDRFNESGEDLYLFVKSKKYYFDLDAVRMPHQTSNNFNYRVRDAKRKEGQPQFKASGEEVKNYTSNYVAPKGPKMGKDKMRNEWSSQTPNYQHELGKNIPTVWQIGSEPHNFQRELGVDVDHFAIFPEALVEIPIKAGCPENGVVMDIFGGSGTVGIVAKRLKRNYLLIELNPKYIKIANKRLRQEILI